MDNLIADIIQTISWLALTVFGCRLLWHLGNVAKNKALPKNNIYHGCEVTIHAENIISPREENTV
jgi:hypothetical protein